MKRIKNPLISIIVPVYNNEKFIGKCLESILAQTYQNFELIVIDDGSTDNTPEILDVFRKTDNRIKLFSQENQGVSAARNKGLNIAQGAYIMFVDGDDYIEPDTLKEALQNIVEKQANVFLFNYETIFYKKHKKYTELPSHALNFEGLFSDAPEDFFDFLPSVCSKLFKNNGMLPQFNESLKKAEDYTFMFEYYLKNPKIALSNKIFYHYVQHKANNTKNKDLIERHDIVLSAEYVCGLSDFKKTKPFIQNQIINRYALSLINESQALFGDAKWPKNYRKSIYLFLIDFYNSEVSVLPYYNALRKLYLKQFFSWLFFRKKTKKISLAAVENTFIKKLQKNQPKYKRDIYLLADCLDGDISECNNAYSLFLYMKEKGLNVYYILLKQNPLYYNLAKNGELDHVIVLPDSTRKICFVEFLYDTLLKTKAIIVSHKLRLKDKFFLAQNPYIDYIYIQHGQTYLKEHILYNGYLNCKEYNYCVIPSEFERKVFKKNGWVDTQFIYTPLPRWDFLPQKSAKKKKILIMFTWRHTKEDLFQKSLYKKKILSLLKDEDLDNYLQANNIELYFALHHSLLGYSHINFKTGYKNFVPVDKISQYIKECSLLITDFSSVAFDFMFQNKPVLFYQIDHADKNLDPSDQEDMAKMAYKKYLVGNVFYNWNDTFEKLKYYIEHNFALERDLRQKYSKFFYFKKDIRKKLTDEIEKICSSNDKK